MNGKGTVRLLTEHYLEVKKLETTQRNWFRQNLKCRCSHDVIVETAIIGKRRQVGVWFEIC